MALRSDPYSVLGVHPRASDEEVRAAYRRLVKLHHPDHNGGSRDSARRFEEVQEAYAQITALRKSGAAPPPPRRGPTPPPPPPPPGGVDARLADIEADLRAARTARDRAAQAARQAAARTRGSAGSDRRASDEELGYVTTDDSFGKILSDAREEISSWLSGAEQEEARERPVKQRVSHLVDELDDIVDKLTGRSKK
jgi:curved DNA-binding protein CbpA